MPSAVTAYSVKIASPGDAAMELIIAREVVGEWNALHALKEKQVLLPLDGEGSEELSDLLVAFFCATKGIPDDPAESDTMAQIEKYLQSARPALIFVSEARAHFAGANAAQEQELHDLKKRYDVRALVETYGNEKEFRAKFAHYLALTVDHHFHFVALGPEVVEVNRPPARELSELARMLLTEACEDFEAYLGRVKIGTTLKIQANGKQLVDQNKPELMAAWESAFEELLNGGFIRDVGYNGQLYQISSKGFDFLKSIGKMPGGYIAEMGSV